MDNTVIYFFRHGKIHNPKKIYYGRHIEMQLSSEGKQDVELVARKLALQHIRLDFIYTSPLSRAVATSHILSSVLHVPADHLIERTDLTDVHIPTLAGKSLLLREEIHKFGFDEYSGKFADAGHETRSDIVRRMYGVLQKILIKHKGQTIGIVSHGDSLRFLLFRLLSKSRTIPPVGELKKIYYPPKGKGWRMVFDKNGKIIEATILPTGESLAIQY